MPKQATYFIQVRSAWQGDRWRTCHKTDDRDIAEFLADGLTIEENQFGSGNPSLTGVRRARFITKTALLHDAGSAAVRQAFDDVHDPYVQFNDKLPKSMNRDTKEREPVRCVTWEAVSEEVDILLSDWEDKQAEKDDVETMSFTLRRIPADIHRAWKKKAFERETAMEDVCIEALQAYVFNE